MSPTFQLVPARQLTCGLVGFGTKGRVEVRELTAQNEMTCACWGVKVLIREPRRHLIRATDSGRNR